MRSSPWISFALYAIAGCATVPAVPPANPEIAAPGAPAVTDGLPAFALTGASRSAVARRSRPEPVAPLGFARTPEPVLPPTTFDRRPVLSTLCGIAEDLRLHSSGRGETRRPHAALVLSIENPDPGCRSAEAFIHTASCDRGAGHSSCAHQHLSL